MKNIFLNGETVSVSDHTTYHELAKRFQKDAAFPIVLVSEDNRIRELFRSVKDGAAVRFITTGDREGSQALRRGQIYLMLKAVNDLYGMEVSSRVRVEFSMSGGMFCTSPLPVTEEFLSAVTARMQELIEQAQPINKRSLPLEEAVDYFTSCGMDDKARLLSFRLRGSVNVYDLEDYRSYSYGYMVPDTGYLGNFKLVSFEDGFVLIYPNEKNPAVLADFTPSHKLYSALQRSTRWCKILGTENIGALNEKIVGGNITDLILAQEALMEHRIGEIAEKIAADPAKKLVMIAGPSSSGKTSFSHRLTIQLMAQGLHPHPVAVDNYFVEREQTPIDEFGQPDFECLGAMDTELFNKQMSALLAGEEVELPTFNFKTGHKEYNGNKMKLGPDDVLVLEGIHCLNDALSYALPAESKFKIYVSALSELNIDEHNRISSSDGRMLRRMVRDARTRGASATKTISMWPSVRRGEHKNIFPYQDSADVVFNSSLVYEISVIKQYAEPLLYSITQDQAEYSEAQRLLRFLDYFQGIDTTRIPQNSLLREFVGGSCFPVG